MTRASGRLLGTKRAMPRLGGADANDPGLRIYPLRQPVGLVEACDGDVQAVTAVRGHADRAIADAALRRGSAQVDVSEFDDFLPLLGFFTNQFAELCG